MARKKRRGEYGKGTVFKPKDRDTWSLAYRVDGVRTYEHGFETEAKARQKLAMINGDLAAERTLASRAKDSLNDLAEKWMNGRRATHRSVYHDNNRWDNHIKDDLGHLKPNEVTVAVLKSFVAKKRKTLGGGTVNLLIRLLSTLYTDLIEDGKAQFNPCRSLSKKTRAAFLRSKHDPKQTPFLTSMADVKNVYRTLLPKSESVAIAFAIGSLAGLRTSEVRALPWEHVDLARNMIHVQVQVEDRKGRDESTWSKDHTQQLKSGESRFVPIQPSLANILLWWREQKGGKGLVCPPKRKGYFLDDHMMGRYLREVLETLGLEGACSCCGAPMGWYECTRHTMASHFVLLGGNLEVLRQIMGHSTVLVTERYAHLMPSKFAPEDRTRMVADFGTDWGKLAGEMAIESQLDERTPGSNRG